MLRSELFRGFSRPILNPSFFQPIRIEGSIIRRKSLTYTKFFNELKSSQKLFGMHSLENFAANTRSFQVKKLLSKILVTNSQQPQYIRTNSDKSVYHKNQNFDLY